MNDAERVAQIENAGRMSRAAAIEESAQICDAAMDKAADREYHDLAQQASDLADTIRALADKVGPVRDDDEARTEIAQHLAAIEVWQREAQSAQAEIARLTIDRDRAWTRSAVYSTEIARLTGRVELEVMGANLLSAAIGLRDEQIARLLEQAEREARDAAIGKRGS